MKTFLATVLFILGSFFGPIPAANAAPSWDCNAYHNSPGFASRYCADTCDYSGDYWIRVKLYQYDPAQGGIVYKYKNGTVQTIGSGYNAGSLSTWDEDNWSIQQERTVSYSCRTAWKTV